MLQNLFASQQFKTPAVTTGGNSFAAAGGIGTAATRGATSPYDQALLPGVTPSGTGMYTNNLYKDVNLQGTGQAPGSIASEYGVNFGDGFPGGFNGSPKMLADNQGTRFQSFS